MREHPSVVYGSHTVSNYHSESKRIVNGEKTTDFQGKDDSHDPEYWINKNILSLLDDGEGGVAPELVGHSRGLSKGHSLRNGETSMMKMAGLSPSLAMEVYQENHKMESLSSVTHEATCITSPEFEGPYFQPLKNGFTKFWNQWKVSNTNPDVVVGYSAVEEQATLSGDDAQPVLVHLMEGLSVDEHCGPARFQNYWSPGAVAFSDPVPSQDFAEPHPLTLDLIGPRM